VYSSDTELVATISVVARHPLAVEQARLPPGHHLAQVAPAGQTPPSSSRLLPALLVERDGTPPLEMRVRKASSTMPSWRSRCARLRYSCRGRQTPVKMVNSLGRSCRHGELAELVPDCASRWSPRRLARAPHQHRVIRHQRLGRGQK
jgi:hypothetical protein